MVQCRCGAQVTDLRAHMRDVAIRYLRPHSGTSLVRLAAVFVGYTHGLAGRQLVLESDHRLRINVTGDDVSFLVKEGQGSLPLAGFTKCGCGYQGRPKAMSQHIFTAAAEVIGNANGLGSLLVSALGPDHGKPGTAALRGLSLGPSLSTVALEWTKAENRTAALPPAKKKKAKTAAPPASVPAAKAVGSHSAAAIPDAPAMPVAILSYVLEQYQRREPGMPFHGKLAALLLTKLPTMTDTVAVDLEGDLREGGEIQLMQVGWLQDDGQPTAMLLDMLEVATFMPALKRFLENESVTKVFHDSRADRLALKAILGIELDGVEDTSIMSDLAYLIRHGETQVAKQGLNALLRKAGLPVNSAKEGFNHESGGVSVWKTRPLTEEMVRYASEDVLYLVDLYKWLEKDLGEARREAMEKGSREFTGDGSGDPAIVTGVVEELTFSPAVREFIGRLEMDIDDDEFLNSFLTLFPKDIAYLVNSETGDDNLQEVAIDEGREITLRFGNGSEREQAFLTHNVTASDIDEMLDLLKNGEEVAWTSDNRYCVPGTLHRVCRLLNTADYDTIGLTYRLGRHVGSSNRLLGDLVHRIAMSLGQRDKKPISVLVLGPPGAGKTTILRQMAALLGESFGRQTAVVDTSLEIAGGGRTPHSCIGKARRFQVEKRDQQHAVLVEVVQNHSPKVIIVDEIGTTKEAHAVRSISQRGVAMLATAHGKTLSDLMKNPDLLRLVGGIQTVTLGAGEVRERRAKQKTVQERAGAPCFQVLVEIISFDELFIIDNVAKAVDDSLRFLPVVRERRWVDSSGVVRRCLTTSRDGAER